MIYLYGVTSEADGTSIPPAGIFGSAIELVTVDEHTLLTEQVAASVLDAMLGEGAREDDTIMHNAVMAHQALLSEIAKTIDVLPFRFGTAVENEDAVQAFVTQEGSGLAETLRTISGHLEWGIKVTRSEAARTDNEASKPASGADYLRQLSANKQSQDRSRESMAELCRAIATDVAELARKVQPLSLRSNDNSEARLLNMACLLPRGGDSDLAATINATVGRFEDLPVRIEISGPWPPFSFASAEESAEA